MRYPTHWGGEKKNTQNSAAAFIPQLHNRSPPALPPARRPRENSHFASIGLGSARPGAGAPSSRTSHSPIYLTKPGRPPRSFEDSGHTPHIFPPGAGSAAGTGLPPGQSREETIADPQPSRRTMRPPGPPPASPRRPRPRGAPPPGAGCVTPRLPRPPAASERLPAPSTPQPPGPTTKRGRRCGRLGSGGTPGSGRAAGPSLPAPPAPPARPRRRGRMHKAQPRARTGFRTAAAGPGRRGSGGGGALGCRGARPAPRSGAWGVAAPRGASGKRPRSPAPHPPPRCGPRPRPGLQTRGGGCGKRRRRRHRQRPSPAMARITHPSPRREAPVGEGGARRGASRETPHAVLPAPCCRRRCGCDGGPGLSAPLGDNVIPHTPHT